MLLLVIYHLCIILLGIGLLWILGDFTVHYALALAHRYKISTFFIGLIILSLASDIPELAVTITAALKGAPEISLNDLLGACFTDITIIIGGAGILLRSLLLKHHQAYHFGYLLMLSTIITIIYCAIPSLPQASGFGLIAIYIIALSYLWYSWGKKQKDLPLTDSPDLILHHSTQQHAKYASLKLFACFGIMMGISSFIVESSTHISSLLLITQGTIGATLIAFGSALPELMVGLNAIKRKDPELIFGAALGTVFDKLTLLLGVLALCSPAGVTLHTSRGTILFLLVSLLITLLQIILGKKITKHVGYSLMLLFFAYIVYHFAW